jgi:hypothetical protein
MGGMNVYAFMINQFVGGARGVVSKALTLAEQDLLWVKRTLFIISWKSFQRGVRLPAVQLECWKVVSVFFRPLPERVGVNNMFLRYFRFDFHLVSWAKHA